MNHIQSPNILHYNKNWGLVFDLVIVAFLFQDQQFSFEVMYYSFLTYCQYFGLKLNVIISVNL